MVRSRLGRDADIGAEECRTEFGNEFLARVGMVAEAFAKLPIAAMGRRSPMDLMPISA